MYVDSHCHLDGPRFESDRAEVLHRAKQAGVEVVLAIGNGNGPDEVDVAIKLAEAAAQEGDSDAPRIWATIGIHPHEAKLATDEHFARMEQLAANEYVIGWGEIGLDYWYDHSPRDVQQRVFIRQMELAKSAKLPIIIHCRPSQNGQDAWSDCLRLIGEQWSSSGLGGVLHCFTGEAEHAKAALDMGFIISFAGNVTYPKALNIQEAAKAVPLDRMFVETDSPYLAPIPHRGKRNEPAYVAKTAEFIANARGMSAEELGQHTTANFYRFFGVNNFVPDASARERSVLSRQSENPQGKSTP